MPKKGKTLLGKKLSEKDIQAIEQVLMTNRDIVELCEKRGVGARDLAQVLWLARNAKANEEKERYADCTRYYAEARGGSSSVDFVSVSTEEGGFQVPYDVFQILFGAELKKGETHDFRVGFWEKEWEPEQKEIGG